MMDPEDIELKVLLDALYLRYGYDFRGYAEASLKRRLLAIKQRLGYQSLSHLQYELLYKPEVFAETLPDFTVTTSEMFRDPPFYRTLREKVLPVLGTYPLFKIWHAGCSTGEEVYSLAIMLKEADLYERCVIYATDVNERALKTARDGIYPAASLQTFTANYQQAGGVQAFTDYYRAAYGAAVMDKSLRENVVFSDHNLVSDAVFSEVHLILCRNVFIYFTRPLQNRVLELFTRSLRYKGFLCFGSKETVRFLSLSSAYSDVDTANKVYQKTTSDQLISYSNQSSQTGSGMADEASL